MNKANKYFEFLNAKSCFYYRCLVDAPANICTPTYLADSCKQIQSKYPNFDLEVLERDQCEKLGMGAYLAVGKGSD